MTQLRFAHRALLDRLLVARALEDPLHVDRRQVDLIGIELADLDELLDLDDRDLAGRARTAG